MEERIVIEGNVPKNLYINADDIKATKEQVPENFTELKELCKILKGCKVEEDYIEIFGCLVGSNILFCKDGAIMLNTDCCFAEKVSVERMWQIIKSLIGEE